MPLIAFRRTANFIDLAWLTFIIIEVIIVAKMCKGHTADLHGELAEFEGLTRMLVPPQAINVDNFVMTMMNEDKPMISNENYENETNFGANDADRATNGNNSRRLERSSGNFSDYIAREELKEANFTPEVLHSLSLHRRKRYLIFPDGSSFQLVFDLIIPIVDFTNYLIMGITCAVAWELPSKPPSEILENFREKLNDGTFGLQRRNDSIAGNKIQYVPARLAANSAVIPLNSITSYNGPNLVTQPLYQQSYHTNSYSSGYESKPKWSKWSQQAEKQPVYYAKPYKPAHVQSSYMGERLQPLKYNNWWELNKERVQQQWQEKQHKWQQQKTYSTAGRRGDFQPNYERIGRKRIILSKPPKHQIFPVFGKKRRRRRYLNSEMYQFDYELDKVHLREHLESRQKLFGKIEKLYQTRGLNGSACVQRALCEAGRYDRQPPSQRRPMSFVSELLRAIFVLPSEDVMLRSKRRHISGHYVEAHASNFKCEERFHECGHSLWETVEFNY